ncbi:MAG: HEAT repeat domain-containing protein, partial [Planctomycetota bacterium]
AMPALLKALAGAEGRVLDALRNAVGSIQGDAADQALIQAMADAKPELRVEIIRLLADRRAASAVPRLLKSATATDPKVREAAFAALGTLAGADALADLVGLLLDAKGKVGRKDAADAVVAAAERVEDATARAEPVVAALAKAEETADRVALVRVLGRIGGGTALKAIRNASKAKDANVKDAAIRALAAWQTAEVAGDLLRVATATESLVHHVLALRGYVRLVGLPADRSATQTLDMLDQAMRVTRRGDEKKLVLGAIGEVPHSKALDMVKPYLEDPALASEAAIATARIAQAISGTETQAARVACEKVLEVSEDQQARKLAQQTLDQINKYADYVTAWEVSGPYTKPGKQGPALHNERFPPEQPDQQAAWTTMPPGGNEPKLPFLMDLYKRFEKENCVAYLRTHIWSPREQEAVLEFGSDDGAKVWLDGKLILNVAQPRSFTEAENKANVTLEEGWNPLLVKVWNGGKWWSAAARFRAPDGSRLEGLRASIKAE